MIIINGQTYGSPDDDYYGDIGIITIQTTGPFHGGLGNQYNNTTVYEGVEIVDDSEVTRVIGRRDRATG